jgi:hypothetical protein
LSAVQQFGLDLLVRQETIDRRKAREDGIRNAMIAAGRKPELVYPDLFPDLPPQKAAPVAEAEGMDLAELDEQSLFQEGVEYDYTGVVPLDPADFERDEAAMLDALMKADHMVMTENPEWSG